MIKMAKGNSCSLYKEILVIIPITYYFGQSFLIYASVVDEELDDCCWARRSRRLTRDCPRPM
jgi:hypothetical protein